MSHSDDFGVSVPDSELFPSGQLQSSDGQREFGISDSQSDLHSDSIGDDDLDSSPSRLLKAAASGDGNADREISPPPDAVPEAASDDDSPASPALSSRSDKTHEPSSTWRNRTAPERELAVSLDKLTANDLSVHLYNAYRLKRTRTRPADSQVETVDGLEEKSAGADWALPKIWTAWPLPPDIVPRELEAKQWSEEAQCPRPYIAKPSRPGRVLQDLLIAQVLRKAKESLPGEEWKTYTPLNQIEPQQSPLLSRTHTTARNNVVLKPMIMTDDERATAILRPTIQHVMTNLDDMLMGLHHARSSYLMPKGPESKIQSKRIRRPSSKLRARKRNRSRPSSATSEKTASQSSSDTNYRDEQFDATAKDEIIRPASRSKGELTFIQRKNRLGLRNWSDVVGVASMTGLDPDVVGKAADRCATLFDQGIKFRTLHEGANRSEEKTYKPHTVASVNLESTESDSESRGMKFGGVHIDGFLQPIDGKKSWKYPNRSQQNSTSRGSRSRTYSRHQSEGFD